MTGTGDGGGSGAVAVLGTGIMGAAMARNLLAAGLPTTVWDRSSPATAALGDAGAKVAQSAQEAVRDARVVITMLPTAQAVDSVIFTGGGAEAFAQGAAWAQMGTIGVTATVGAVARLGQVRPDVMLVDAPVSGSKGPAEAGQLLILASGPQQARPVVGPAFTAVGRKTVWLGEAGQGSRMKLVVNAYMCVLIEGVAEALELARRMGVDTARLAESIEGGPLDAPIADAKLHKMEAGDYAPEFPFVGICDRQSSDRRVWRCDRQPGADQADSHGGGQLRRRRDQLGRAAAAAANRPGTAGRRVGDSPGCLGGLAGSCRETVGRRYPGPAGRGVGCPGGRSMWALRIHQTTTYFTGMLTKAISGASTGSIGACSRTLGWVQAVRRPDSDGAGSGCLAIGLLRVLSARNR
jgi:3-hydroxyisobutyrate dehydrogenase